MFDSELVLRPNCLLTRKPIIFITGPRSLFYYNNPWKAASNYLYQHGYIVKTLRLPFQSNHDRKKYLLNNIHLISNSHVFCDTVTYSELIDLFAGLKKSTVTFFSNSDEIKAAKNKNIFSFKVENVGFSLGYLTHQKYLNLKGIKTPSYSESLISPSESTYSKLLDHCVHLAELDFYDLDLNQNS